MEKRKANICGFILLSTFQLSRILFLIWISISCTEIRKQRRENAHGWFVEKSGWEFPRVTKFWKCLNERCCINLAWNAFYLEIVVSEIVNNDFCRTLGIFGRIENPKPSTRLEIQSDDGRESSTFVETNEWLWKYPDIVIADHGSKTAWIASRFGPASLEKG